MHPDIPTTLPLNTPPTAQSDWSHVTSNCLLTLTATVTEKRQCFTERAELRIKGKLADTAEVAIQSKTYDHFLIN